MKKFKLRLSKLILVDKNLIKTIFDFKGKIIF